MPKEEVGAARLPGQAVGARNRLAPPRPTRILCGVAVAAPRELMAPDPAYDPFVQALLERSAAEAYARGHADGTRAAVAEAAAAGARAAAAVRDALDAAVAARREVYSQDAQAAAELGCAVAEIILGREPHDDGAALVARLTEALAALDDDGLVVAVAPADVDVVAGAIAGVDVRAEAGLRPGEARVRGTWAQADLTHAAALRAVRALLEAGNALG